MSTKNLLLRLVIVLFLSNSFVGHAQEAMDLSALNLSEEQSTKINSALVAMDAVQKAEKYIQSLSDLFSDGKITLPVGIKQNGYELIIQRIDLDKQTGKQLIYATCAFRFKNNGQPIAFEGQAVLEGENGLGTQGKLTLIAPICRNLGRESALIIREGSSVHFGCEGIESFDTRMEWQVTSDQIIAVDRQGHPTNRPLSVFFETRFNDFDNYLLSLDIDQSFAVKGLDDVLFTLKGATLDQSDTETSPMTRFPENYLRQGGADAVRLWKGLAVSEAFVSLPSFFKQPEGGNDRVRLSLQEVLFDENGFSGHVAAENLIPGDHLDPESWVLSLTGFSLNILKNNVVAFGMSGDINMPPFGKNSLRPYTAVFNPTMGKYEFRTGIAGTYDFPVLQSTLSLNELSTIDIQVRNNDIYPVIRATGKLSVHAPLGEDSNQVFSLPDIDFENMQISRESPYLQLGAIRLNGNLQSPQLAGFELSITNICPFTNEKGGGLSFQAGISLNEMFSGITGIKLYGDYAHWKFKEIEVDRVAVEYRSGAFDLKGDVWFKSGDPVYGDGFRGKVGLSILDQISFDAIGVFGKKEDYRYFLADVLYETTPTAGIPIPPALSIYGFGGGLYRRMQQDGKSQPGSGSEFGQSLSGIRYLPDKKVGLGVMANALLATIPGSDAFNATLSFEMQFNSSGGLNFAQLRGSASFMDVTNKLGPLSDHISDRMKLLESSNNKQPEKALKFSLEKVPETKSQGVLTASILLEYDLNNRTFSADLYSFLNAGLVKGAGEGDRLGWASAYFAPDKWYMYMGTPTDPLGIKVLNLAELNSYFMMGDEIPALPLPPEKVVNLLSPDKQEKLKRRHSNHLSSGKGIAFGAKLNTKFNARFTPFYARLDVGLGGEFTLTQMNGSTCSNYDGIPGINGWYADAQAWAYLEAAIGIQAKIFGERKNFSILDLTTGTLLQGAGPNPFYFAGAVGGRYNILGGLIKGNCNFDFEIGQQCIRETGSPFGEDVIAQLSPGSDARDVSVFAAPQAIFNVPVGVEMVIEEDDIKGIYMAVLEEFKVKYKEGGQVAKGRDKYSEDGTVYVLTPDEPFESRKEVEVYAKVVFKKRILNNWEYVNGDDGKPVYETKTAVFRTGDRPKEIQPEHVKYSYPIHRQYNFYADEYKQGYIQLIQNYSYLFSTEKPEGFDQKIRLSNAEGTVIEMPFTCTTHTTGNGIQMEIGFQMDQVSFVPDKIYKLAIMNIPQQTNASVKSNISSETIVHSEGVEITRQRATETLKQLSEKEVYALSFRTSTYKTFAEKVKVFDKRSEGGREYVEPYVHNIKTNLKEPELFDAYEIQGIDNERKLVQFTAQVHQTAWYTQTFYNEMYRTQTYVQTPVQKIEIWTGAEDKLLTDDEIRINRAFGFGTSGNQGVFSYVLPYWCSRDFFAVKENIARKNLGGQVTSQELHLLNTDYPPVVFKGDYPVSVSYVLPGRNITTSTVDITMYNPVTP
ncbi:MAG: hypothetical protein LBS46_09255 [Dysgonamonadaceae bacterium]|jgi:hypothetical protein|nr:hypothetical protein [Dysgonamonadaceae bacterium]